MRPMIDLSTCSRRLGPGTRSWISLNGSHPETGGNLPLQCRSESSPAAGSTLRGGSSSGGGNRISDLEERQLHRLRIGIKKLRYAVGFLGPLYARKRVRKSASSLEKMQDCLGLIHDDIVSRQIASDFD